MILHLDTDRLRTLAEVRTSWTGAIPSTFGPRSPSLADVAVGYLAAVVAQLRGDGRPGLPVDPLPRARQSAPRRPARKRRLPTP